MPASEEDALETSRWGTRFVRRDTEADYRAWQREYPSMQEIRDAMAS